MFESISKRILLVEDEAILAMNEKMELEKYGYAVRTVATGEKAVEAAKTIAEIDLILMDIDLGNGIDGTQAAEIILKNQDIPVVFLSSHTDPEIVGKTEKITSYGYVVKNSNITVLDASIKMAFKLFDANKKMSNELVERRRAEEKIQEMDVRLRKLFANVPDLIFQFTRRPDGSYHVPIASEGIINIFGCSPEDVRDDFEPISRVLYPEDAPRVIEDIEYSAKHLSYFTCEFRVRIPGRDIQWILSRSMPEKLPDGSVTWYGFNVDITERRKAEEALRKSEAIKKAMVANIGDVIVVIDKNGMNQYKSPNITRLFGWKPEELVGKNTWDTVHPDDVQASQIFFGTILSEPNASGTTELRYKRKDGTYVWIEITIRNLLHDLDMQGILGNYHDITERKKTEETLARTTEMLHRTGEMAKVGGWELDLLTNTMFFSREALLINEVDPLEGLTLEEAFDRVDSEYRPQLQAAVQAAIENGAPYDIDLPMVTATGRHIWSRTQGSVLLENGRAVKLCGAFQDITERKKTEEEIQKQLSEKEILLREVHHRVKNNIANIQSLLSLQADSAANVEVKAALQDSISRIQSMRVLYEKILSSDVIHEVSIKNYAEGLIDSLVMAYDSGKNITIEKHIYDFKIDARNAFFMGIIINELLTNVFKYAFRNHDVGIVSVSIDKEEDDVILMVQDNGSGFDEKALENKSPGFGRTIVRMLVEQLDGTYSSGNEDGARSVVRFGI